MKTSLRKIALFVLCCLSPFTSLYAGGGIVGMTIGATYQRECAPSKGLEITFTAPHLNPDQCSNSTTVEVSCDQPSHKQILAMVLTAQSSGFVVDAWVSGCDAEGQAIVIALDSPIIDNIDDVMRN